TTSSHSTSGGSSATLFFRCPLARGHVRCRLARDTKTARTPAVARKIRIQAPDRLIRVGAASGTLQRDEDTRHDKPPSKGAPAALLDSSLPQAALRSCQLRLAIIEHVQFSCQGLIRRGRDVL